MTALALIKLISEAGLVGRGGAAYPVAKKWQAVKEALKNKRFSYIVVNAAEGEPGVKKDGYILEHHLGEVVKGIDLADQFLGRNKVRRIYFFINHEYERAVAKELKKILAAKKYSLLSAKLELITKPQELTYISGEESTILNIIEGRRTEPRLRPPYPTTSGLYGKPTLINNVETFYDVSLVAASKFKNERFYTVTGAVTKRGVYVLPSDLTIAEVLQKTDNLPKTEFFVQIGGGVSGEVLNQNQLDGPVTGAGSIMVYDKRLTDKAKLLKYWLSFYRQESCGNCTVCREGTYRLLELINEKEFNEPLFKEIISALEDSSFCALGRSIPVPIKSYFANILKK